LQPLHGEEVNVRNQQLIQPGLSIRQANDIPVNLALAKPAATAETIIESAPDTSTDADPDSANPPAAKRMPSLRHARYWN
jgi:hypothetical protein